MKTNSTRSRTSGVMFAFLLAQATSLAPAGEPSLVPQNPAKHVVLDSRVIASAADCGWCRALS